VAPDDENIHGVPSSDLVALLSVPPEEFVAARAARVKELRADGRRDEAAALAKVRRPVRLVWAVGEVARRDPELAAEAAAVAEEAEDAMAGGGDVRSALERYREVTGRVSAASGKIDRAVDRASLELALRQVLADPVARTAWLEGRLVELPRDEPAPADELAPRRARRAAAKKAADADEVEPNETESKAVAAERKQRARALEGARSLAAKAKARLADARAAHDDAVDTSEEVQERLAEVQAEAADAQRTVEDAAVAVADAEQNLADTEATIEELQGD